jgi:hypothetical protein
MAITRSSIKTGPAIVGYNGAKIYFKDGLTLNETVETFDLSVDNWGPKTDQRVQDRYATVSGTPAGEWRDLAVLWPWLNSPVGTRLHGDTDTPLVIHALDGTLYTYHNAAITTMPALTFAATQTLLGNLEFTCRVKDNTEPTAAGAIFTRSTATFTDASFQIARVRTQPYTLKWGAAPWDNFKTTEGVSVEFGLSTEDITADGYGVLDQILTGVDVTAKFTPLGVAQAALDAKLALQGAAAAAQGASLHAKGETLLITGVDVHVALYNVAARTAAQNFGMTKLRAGEVEAVATRGFDESNNPLPLAYLGTEPPAN